MEAIFDDTQNSLAHVPSYLGWFENDKDKYAKLFPTPYWTYNDSPTTLLWKSKNLELDYLCIFRLLQCEPNWMERKTHQGNKKRSHKKKQKCIYKIQTVKVNREREQNDKLLF